MIRGRSLIRIGGLLACACVALAAGAPTTAGAQSAVDEYTLGIPGAGGSGSGKGAPPSANAAPPSANAAPPDAAVSGAASGSGGASNREAGSGAGYDGGSAGGGNGSSGAQSSDAPRLQFDALHSGVTSASSAAKADRRSAPEVVADTLLDGAMLPLLVALMVITGIGAWRVLRHRRTLTGAPG